jgi:catechol 2,3-dioxygenase-like lactoylglutathione lyase family enzyme
VLLDVPEWVLPRLGLLARSEVVLMSPVTVRYIVDDVDAALVFYCSGLGFEEVMHPGQGFAMVARDDLRLALNAVGGPGGASQAMPDGSLPQPGGWNRIQIEVEQIEVAVAALRTLGAQFRNDIVSGMGGRQTLVEDPSGNPVELFEPFA